MTPPPTPTGDRKRNKTMRELARRLAILREFQHELLVETLCLNKFANRMFEQQLALIAHLNRLNARLTDMEDKICPLPTLFD